MDETQLQPEVQKKLDKAQEIGLRIKNTIKSIGSLSDLGITLEENEISLTPAFRLVKEDQEKKQNIFKVGAHDYIFSDTPDYLFSDEGKSDLIHRVIDAITEKVPISRFELNRFY